MPVPLAPYPTPPVPYTPPANEPARVLWMSKPFTVSGGSNFCMLCCLQCSHSCATSRHGNGPIGLWRVPYLAYVHPWSNKRTVFLLSHCQSSLGSKPGGTRQLWQLQDAINVPIWSTICEMCCLQFCDIGWGLSKHNGTEIPQLKFLHN